jgi:hypothetical protein
LKESKSQKDKTRDDKRVRPITPAADDNSLEDRDTGVYVIPPAATMTIEDHTLRLTARPEVRMQHMPVDSFMRALAEAQGNKAIGVIASLTCRISYSGAACIDNAITVTPSKVTRSTIA